MTLTFDTRATRQKWEESQASRQATLQAFRETAKLKTIDYTLIVPRMPLLKGESQEAMIRRIYELNPAYKGQIVFIRATFSKKAEKTTKSHTPFILGVKELEQANLVCERGLVIRGELYNVKLYFSGARAKRCYNCQLYTSYIVKHYIVKTRYKSC